ARQGTEGHGGGAQTLVEVATLDGAPVRSFSGAMLQADRAIAEIADTDLIIVSGIWGEVEPFLERHRDVVGWLERQYGRGALIGCLSTGTFLLAETGLLEGRPATIYWRMVEPFRTRYPGVILQPERPITAADNLYCSAGVSSGIELTIYLIERIWGIAAAQKVSRNFLMDLHRRQPDFQLAFDDRKRHGDGQILAAQQWLEMNFSADFLLEEVADRVGLGLRSFMRRFKSATGDTPIGYLQRVRLEVAKEMLRDSSFSIDEISHRIGYQDVSFFSRLFKRATGQAPGEYRRGQQRGG
ncbi:MAG: helix-turn-helix domain-containing protein, partial [Alphaproteobacteria bacterium]|nr:helix-turn-helix domain-containing protein [Alphaproteobacteria bacterium]